MLIPKAIGELKVKVSVENGKEYGKTWTKEFTLTIQTLQSNNLNIADGNIVIRKEDDTHLRIEHTVYPDGYRIIDKEEPIIISGSATDQYRVIVESGEANITLDNCTIGYSVSKGDGPFKIVSGAVVNLTLEGTNVLTHTKSGSYVGAVRVESGAVLNVGGTGNLTATGLSFDFYPGISISGTVTVNSGTVTAAGGWSIRLESGGGIFVVNGGTVNAGTISSGRDGKFTINGGTVNAGKISTSNTTIAINGGNLQVTGEEGIDTTYGSLRINGGKIVSTKIATEFTGHRIEISGGTVTVDAISKGTSIITGGSIKAGSITETPKNNASQTVLLNTITLQGVTSSTRVTGVAGITGYGFKDVWTLDDGKLYLYLPENNYSGLIIATEDGKTYKGNVSNGAGTLTSFECSHNWKYTADDADGTITANCKDCQVASGGSISLTVPTDSVYTGNSIEAAVEGAFTTGANHTLTYEKEDGSSVSGKKPVNAGSYKAVLSVTDSVETTVCVTKTFTIAKADPTVSDFAVTLPKESELTYSGEEKKVTAQAVSAVIGMGAVTVTYYDETENASGELLFGAPVNAGSYRVKLDVAEGSNYKAFFGLTDASWIFKIAQATATTEDPQEKQGLVYNSEEQELLSAGTVSGVTGGAAEGCQWKYSLNGTDWSENVPTASTANETGYTVYYKLDGGRNYKSIGQQSVNVKIQKAEPNLSGVTAFVGDNITDAVQIQFQGALDVSGKELAGTYKAAEETGTLIWGENTVNYTFTPVEPDSVNYKEVTGTVKVTVEDTTVPSGEVMLAKEENIWTRLLDILEINFDLLFNQNVDVTVTAEDALSKVAKVEYYETAAELSLDDIKTVTDWKDMKVGQDGKAKVSVAAEDTKKFVYYIRITDHAGNIAYLSTNGATFDTQPPVVTGITDGAVYYTTQKFAVTEIHPGTVTVNEQEVSDYTLTGNVEAEYKVTVTDGAGNSTVVTVSMKPIASLGETIQDLNEENVTGADTDIIAAVETALQAVDVEDATEEEKAALASIQEKVDALQKVIEDTAAEVKALEDAVAGYDKESIKLTDEADVTKLITDLTEKLNDTNLTPEQKDDLTETLKKAQELTEKITADQIALEEALTDQKDTTEENYTVADKADLEAAADALENIIKEENQNYIEGEKKEAQEELDRINKLIESIERVEDAVKKADDAVNAAASVDAAELPDHAAAVEKLADAKQAYEALSEKEKTLLNADQAAQIQKVEALYEEAVSFWIIKGMDGVFTKGTSKELEFTANGTFDLFAEVRVDGEMVDASDYTVNAGSKIVTLKADYLKTLSNGEHSFEVIYDVLGKEYSAGCMFKVKKAAAAETEAETSAVETEAQTGAKAADTGDDTNITIWLSMMLASALGALLLGSKKKKHYN